MSTNTTYKSNLTVGGSAVEKSKLHLRRPTPDSDALASSDDDRDHVPPVVRPAAGGYPGGRRPSSGWLQDIQPTNRKYSLPSVSFAGSQPTTPSLELPQQARPGAAAPAFPWNTTSFTSGQSNSRLKEVLPSPTSAFAPHEKPLPSPTNIDGDKGIGFLLDQQNPNPLRKAVRSQSYSIGQGDIENSPVGQFSARFKPNLRHRPSKPSLLGESAIGLSQLREDDVDDVESSNGSEHGVRLPAGYWDREHKQQVLLKQAAVENARVRNMNPSAPSPISQQRRKTTAGLRNVSYGNTTEYAIEEMDDHDAATTGNPSAGLVRRFSEHVAGLAREPEADLDAQQKQQWTTGNIAPMNVDSLGRRHSFAHYGSHVSAMPLSKLSNTQEEDEDVTSPRQNNQQPEDKDAFDAAAYFNGYGPASRAINSSAISIAHPDPIVPNTAMSAANPYAVPQNIGRPGRRLFVVTFKCSRADIYYLYDNTGLEIHRGDLVIVEGDRGCDLGQVTHADVSLEDAKKFKAEANEEHFRWLVMFSQYSLAGSNDTNMLGALARANGFPNPMSRGQITGMGATQDQDAKPKMIKRLAQQHEIMGLRDKEGQEAKAKRLGAQKAGEHKLPMEILDAEYQADYHKLTYFYYAEAYVNFNELVTDLFKQYKVRIWMSAVNPASVVNPAGMNQVPPPSAIGPGAILNSSTPNNALAVGPGFGQNSNRGYQQQGRGRGNAPYAGNYDDGFNAFSQQLPTFQPQNAYNQLYPHPSQMPQNMHRAYGGYGVPVSGYPNASASGSPMNFGQFYPPAPGPYVPANAYQAPANGSPYQGGNHAQPYNGQYTTSGANAGMYQHGNPPPGTTPVKRDGAGTPGGHGNANGNGNGNSKGDGSAAMPGQNQGAGVDPSVLVAMHNMTFGGK